MKILKVAFKNLNSLVGSKEIDLEAGPLANAGIFAITGPTGAGKSTILDAITLALYGRAARYGTSANPVDMMSRQTGDSSAEVVFEVPAGRFRASWHLRRAHGKSGAKVQPVKRHLYEISADEERPIAEKANDVKQKIEELVGLDAERFLRSALLAQNEFARFLKSSADERATLLESLTGTDIYTRLGSLAYRTLADRERELKSEEDRWRNIALMTDEQRQESESEIAKHEKQTSQLDKRIETLQHEIARGDRFFELSAKHESLQKSRETLLAEVKEFNAKRQQLVLHRKASEIAGELQRFDQLEEDVLRLQKTCEQTKADSHRSAVELRSGIEAAVLLSERRSQELKREIKENEKQEVNLRTAIEKNASWLESNQADGQIADLLPEITASIEKLSAARSRLNETNGLGQQLIERTATASQKESQFQSSLEDARKSLGDSQQHIKETQKIFGETGQGKTILQVENEIDGLRDLLQRLRELQQLCETSNEAARDLEALKSTVNEVNENLVEAEARLELVTGETQQQRELVEAYKTAFDRLQLIASMQDHRDELKPDEECPLCGSLEHPLANQQPVTNSARKEEGARLTRAEAAYKRLHESERLAERMVDKLTVRKNEKQRSLQSRQKVFDEAHQKLSGLAAEISVADPTLDVIAVRMADEVARKSSLEKQAARMREIMQEIANAEKGKAKAESDERACQIELQNCRKQLATIQNEKQTLAEKVVVIRRSIASCQSTLKQQIEPLGESLGEPEDSPGDEQQNSAEIALRDSLNNRIAGYREKSELHRTLESDTKNLGVQKEKLNQRETQIAETLQRQVHRREDDLVRDVEPDKSCVEQSLESWDSIEAGDLQLQTLRSTADAAHATAQNATKSLTETQQRSFDARDALSVRIESSSFDGVDALRSALLTHEAAGDIEKRQHDIDSRTSRNEGELTAVKQSMDELIESNVSQGELLDLNRKERADSKQKLNEQKDELARLKNELKTDDANRKLHEELGREFHEQQRQLETWRQLKSLIGSSNGSLFKRFAQGLSLDVLVRLANRHMNNLSERYVLQRVKGEQLDMEICDMHQGGTRRPMASLSGGESFIASLALALGLSDLAGRNVRIDSLFIDEGFGALDPDTLDVAVAALEGLQSSNKTIGVISHVELLKERITTQIQVVPSGGGVSELHIVS